MIGKIYDHERYNCSHVVADYYRERLSIDVPSSAADEWSFTLWMRRRFTRVERPVQDCIVLARSRDGKLHVGVYDDGLVTHGHRLGQVVRSPLALIKGELTYWTYNGNDSVLPAPRR